MAVMVKYMFAMCKQKAWYGTFNSAHDSIISEVEVMDNVLSYLAPSCFMECFFSTARVDSLQDVVTGTDHRTLHGFLAAWKQQGTPLSPQLRATISSLSVCWITMCHGMGDSANTLKPHRHLHLLNCVFPVKKISAHSLMTWFNLALILVSARRQNCFDVSLLASSAIGVYSEFHSHARLFFLCRILRDVLAKRSLWARHHPFKKLNAVPGKLSILPQARKTRNFFFASWSKQAHKIQH